jgi:protein-tyrosine phosphatase
MKNKKRIEVLSQNLFDEKMKELGLDDNNVEDTNLAFVSIIGTPDCLKYYLDEEDTKHYFKDHPNVINLDFDDITYDEIDWKGHKIKGLSMEQAQKLFEFIENNKDKDFYIHCRAGMSR